MATHQPRDARDWDQHYGDTPIWSGQPNGALVAEVADLPAGAALDVGCGEGADAIWLARRGWQVTALDPSQVALDRARAAAVDAGVDVTWHHAGLLDAPTRTGRYDLVSALYPAIPRSDAAILALIDAVAPSGTLLVVHHQVEVAAHAGHNHGFDPGDYFVMPADVHRHLIQGWVVEVDEARPRPGPIPKDALHVEDLILRARRSNALPRQR